MISKIRDLEEALGTEKLILSPKMLQSRKFQRSLFVTEDIKKGELFTNLNIRSIRPGIGLLPKNFESILGKKATVDIQKGTPLSLDLIQLS